MTKLLLSCFLCVLAMGAFAQDTVPKKNSIGKFDEQFMVLKSDKKVKHGSYRLFTDKKLAAAGNYTQGKRSGIWNFYNGDALEQQYDYTNNKLVMNVPGRGLTCEVESANPGDSVKKAVKIGGFNGFKLMIASTDFDSQVTGGGKITHAVSIDENGQIKSWVATVKNADGIKVITQSFAEVPADVAQFLPAMVNGKPAASTITFNSEMNGQKGGEDSIDQGKPKMRGGGGGRRGGE